MFDALRTTLSEKILALVAKHPRYPKDLYNTCARGSAFTRTQFHDLLAEMEREGEIHINANRLVLLPKPPSESKLPPKEPPAPPKKEVENRTDPRRYGRKDSITLKCGTLLLLTDLEDAGLSYVPCARLPNAEGELEDKPYFAFSSLWGEHSQVTLSSYGKRANGWSMTQWKNSEFPGVQLMTGKPTFRPDPNSPDGFVYLTDLDVEHRLIAKYPAVFEKILSVYRNACDGTPCEIETKSGGQRLSAYVPMLDGKRFFRDSDGSMLFEIFSENGLSRLDSRYAMISGSVLDLPRVPREALQEIHGIISEVGVENERTKSSVAIPATDENLPEGLTWKQGNKFLISTDRYDCTQSHASNPTCEYRKHDDGTVIKWCWACDTGWRIVKGENQSRVKVKKVLDTSQKRPHTYLDGIEPIITLPPDHRIINSAPIGINEPPVFPYFLPEDRKLIRACGYDPDASYAPHGNGRKPVWVTQYQKLYNATGLFKLNGQPKYVETYRVWNTLFEICPDCQKQTRAFWIDRFHLEAGTYCNTCHTDIRTNSTLNLELQRKLTNAYTSTFDGFIGSDPFWKDTPLWKPGRHTHLGAAMAQGKTTFIQDTSCEIARSENKFFIICVPRISLALNIASKLNRQYGEKAFGIYYESSRHKYHGRIGAVCTLTSLPLLFQGPEPLDPQDCLIFIDEIDFSYPLTELVTPQAQKVKTALRQALHANGLVTAGQTEYTAVVEAFAEEMETDDVFGYYKTAAAHDGQVRWIEYPNTSGKEIQALAGIAESIHDGLVAGQIIHAFTSERRQADVLAKMFESENLLVYSSLTKHQERNKKLLQDRKLTDTKLFIATSAADVGISIEDDRDSRTLILPTLLFGRIPIESATQESARVRGTQHIEIHVPFYKTALPLKPTETKNVFQHSLTLKREIAAIEDDDFLTESRIATKKSTTRTLRELAEQQPLTFVENHLHRIAGYQIDVVSQPTPVAKSKLDEIRVFKKESLSEETEKRQEYAEKVIEAEMERLSQLKADPTTYLPAFLQSATEIRQSAADGYITSFNLLGQRYVNELAVAIGFDDVPDRIRSGDPENPQPFDWNDADLPCIQNLVNVRIDATRLTDQIHGYIASRDRNWIQQHTEAKLLDLEWTAVKDYRGIGTLARLLCEKLQGYSWHERDFAMAIHETLHTETATRNPMLSDIKIGALGDKIYKKARFLFKIEDTTLAESQVLQRYTDFAISVVETYLPVKIRRQTLKNKDTDEKNAYFTLVDSNTIDVFEQALNCYLAHNIRQGRDVKHHTVNRIGIPETEKQKRQTEAVQMKKDGKTRSEIAEATGLSERTVATVTNGINPTKSRNADQIAKAKQLYDNGNGKSYREIGHILKKAPNTIKNWCQM